MTTPERRTVTAGRPPTRRRPPRPFASGPRGRRRGASAPRAARAAAGTTPFRRRLPDARHAPPAGHDLGDGGGNGGPRTGRMGSEAPPPFGAVSAGAATRVGDGGRTSRGPVRDGLVGPRREASARIRMTPARRARLRIPPGAREERAAGPVPPPRAAAAGLGTRVRKREGAAVPEGPRAAEGDRRRQKADMEWVPLRPSTTTMRGRGGRRTCSGKGAATAVVRDVPHEIAAPRTAQAGSLGFPASAARSQDAPCHACRGAPAPMPVSSRRGIGPGGSHCPQPSPGTRRRFASPDAARAERHRRRAFGAGRRSAHGDPDVRRRSVAPRILAGAPPAAASPPHAPRPPDAPRDRGCDGRARDRPPRRRGRAPPARWDLGHGVPLAVSYVDRRRLGPRRRASRGRAWASQWSRGCRRAVPAAVARLLGRAHRAAAAPPGGGRDRFGRQRSRSTPADRPPIRTAWWARPGALRPRR